MNFLVQWLNLFPNGFQIISEFKEVYVSAVLAWDFKLSLPTQQSYQPQTLTVIRGNRGRYVGDKWPQSLCTATNTFLVVSMILFSYKDKLYIKLLKFSNEID